MIDRSSRDKFAAALRQYAAGRITNDCLAQAETCSNDRGVIAVQDVSWQLYSDMSRHYAAGRHALGSDTLCAVARCVLFLQTDDEYLWPAYDFIACENRLDRWVMDLFTCGKWSERRRERWRDFVQAGDYEAWPFLRKEHEASARQRLEGGV